MNIHASELATTQERRKHKSKAEKARKEFISNMKSDLDKKLDTMTSKSRLGTAANGPEQASTTEPNEETIKSKRKSKSGTQFAFKSMSREQYQKAQSYIYKSEAPPPGNYRTKFQAVEP